MFLAEVTAVQADEAYLNEKGKFELNKTGLLAYSHGEYLGLGKKIGTFGYSVKKKSDRRRKRGKSKCFHLKMIILKVQVKKSFKG